MKGEVFKGFMRRAAQCGISHEITFPQLVKLVFPRLARKYQTHKVFYSEQQIQKQREQESSTMWHTDQMLNEKQLQEIRIIFASLEKDEGGSVSFQTMLDSFGGNGLSNDEEFVEQMHIAAGSKSMKVKAQEERLRIRKAAAATAAAAAAAAAAQEAEADDPGERERFEPASVPGDDASLSASMLMSVGTLRWCRACLIFIPCISLYAYTIMVNAYIGMACQNNAPQALLRNRRFGGGTQGRGRCSWCRRFFYASEARPGKGTWRRQWRRGKQGRRRV